MRARVGCRPLRLSHGSQGGRSASAPVWRGRFCFERRHQRHSGSKRSQDFNFNQVLIRFETEAWLPFMASCSYPSILQISTPDRTGSYVGWAAPGAAQLWGGVKITFTPPRRRRIFPCRWKALSQEISSAIKSPRTALRGRVFLFGFLVGEVNHGIIRRRRR